VNDDNHQVEEGSEDTGPEAPRATGVDADVSLLGPEEIQAVFQKAEERDELERRVTRLQADFDNIRRRQSKEREQTAHDEAVRVLGPVFDFLDSFGRALESSRSNKDFDGLVGGIELALREVERGLQEAGVERVSGEGEPLDPAVHQAILQEPSEDVDPMTVTGVLSSGWKRRDLVLRPAMVKVATAPSGESGEGGDEGNG
jgi:molecular chaperone GrpE